MLFDDDRRDDTIVFPGEKVGNVGYGTTGSGRPPSAIVDLDLPPPPSQTYDMDDEGVVPTGRPKNFPPCKPMVHHNIKNDIDMDRRLFIRRAYVGFYFHTIALFVNLIVVTAGLAEGEYGVISLLEAIAGVILGPPIAFLVYYLVYTGVRKNSTVYFCLWFVLFGAQIVMEGIFASGLWVGAGLIGMIDVFPKSLVVGIMFLVSTVSWVGCAVYNVLVVLNGGRKEYSALGGHRAAAKGFVSAGASVAYNNRDTIADVARDNKDAIREFAVEHKDEIRDFAVDNRDVISEVAYDNRAALAQAAIDNPGLAKSSRSEVDAIFQ